MDRFGEKYLTLKLLKNTLMCNFRIYFTFSLELLIVKYCKKKKQLKKINWEKQ